MKKKFLRQGRESVQCEFIGYFKQFIVTVQIFKPLTGAQQEVLRGALPSRHQTTTHSQEQPMKPPPPYEIAASSSRQGMLAVWKAQNIYRVKTTIFFIPF